MCIQRKSYPLSPAQLQGGAKPVVVKAVVAIVTTVIDTLAIDLHDAIMRQAQVVLNEVLDPTLMDHVQDHTLHIHTVLVLVLVQVLVANRGVVIAPLVLGKRRRKRNNVANDLATASSRLCYVA